MTRFTGHGMKQAIRSILMAVVLALPSSASQSDSARTLLSRAANSKQFGSQALLVVKNYLEHNAAEIPERANSTIRDLLGNPFNALGAAAKVEKMTRARQNFRRSNWQTLFEPLQSSQPGRYNCKAGSSEIGAIIDWYIATLDDVLKKSIKPLSKSCPSLADGEKNKTQILNLLIPDAKGRALRKKIGGAKRPALGDTISARWFTLHRELAHCIRALKPESLAAIKPKQFMSRFGRVVIGGTGNDTHEMREAFMVVDLGGSDRYHRSRAGCGEAKVIVDLSGDDIYQGDDASLYGFQASIDLTGDDRYLSADAGNAATYGGLSLLLDLAGNDTYRNGKFGQAAAAYGVAALIDGSGNDKYEIVQAGQGFGATGGVGFLWDAQGDDFYTATGDLSMAQGSAYGWRFLSAGGIGILADDAGHDNYRAKRFAQGSGYYFGTGILRDRAGKDRYKAIRYAQGAGIHMGFGMLEDIRGDDAYEAEIGVSQGMGLDLAFGILRDHSGDDTYRAPALAQGAGTSNGTGILIDTGGRDKFSLDDYGWGRDHVSRRLPGLGFLLGADPQDMFYKAGKRLAEVDAHMAGPNAGLAPRIKFPILGCPAPKDSAREPANPDKILNMIEKTAPFCGLEPEAIANFCSVIASFPKSLKSILKKMDPTNSDAIFALRGILRCYLGGARNSQKEAVAEIIVEDLVRPQRVLPAWLHGGSLLRIPGTVEKRKQAIEILFADGSCKVQRFAIELIISATGSSKLPPWAETMVTKGLANQCWAVQAASIRAKNKYLYQNKKIGTRRSEMPSFIQSIEALSVP
jgi:hypothetical protein